MKVIETVTTTIDMELLKDLFKKHACDKEMPKLWKWYYRLEEDGTLFLRKRHKMKLSEYQSVYFGRFCTFVEMATVRKHLTCKLETV